MDESKPIIKTYTISRGNCRGKVFTLILDAEGVILFNAYKWCVSTDPTRPPYLRRNVNGKTIYFHKEIFGATSGIDVDHINRDSLDNRLCNLRITSRSQNLMNTGIRRDNVSGHRGVSWENESGRWRAVIRINNKQQTIGRYVSFQEACNTYDKKAQELFGEYLGEVSNA